MKTKKELQIIEEDSNFDKIALTIDTYDDIFSDFDFRPFSIRALSVDFLEEAERASRDKNIGEIILEFSIPKHERVLRDEEIIKKRLKEHFKKHNQELEKEKKGILKLGLWFSFFGILSMFSAAYVLYFLAKLFWTSFLVILLEPAGWFLFWEGLNLIVFKSKEINPQLIFYRKMHLAEIVFKDD